MTEPMKVEKDDSFKPFPVDAPDDWPDNLCKALVDQPFEYMLVLRNGSMIRFDGASKSREGWVLLSNPRNQDDSKPWGCLLDRGLEVRVADIMAVADAPHGS